MNSNGVMGEIRSLLSEGRSSTETIALGYKPSTVYKAQRQLGRSTSVSSPPVTTQVLFTNMASEDGSKLREEIQALQEQVASLAEVTAERDSLREDLDSALTQMEELALAANQAQMWQERFSEVEPAVAEAADLRRKVHDLNRHLSHAQTVMTQEVQQWQAKLQQEQQSRREAEDLVSRRGSEIVQLKTEKQGLAQQLEAIPGFVSDRLAEVLRPLHLELEQLRPLKVWSDQPCSECGKPVHGIPTRELAAKLLRRAGLVHRQCGNQ